MLHHFKGTRLAWIRSFLLVISLTMIVFFIFSIMVREKVTQEAIASNNNSSAFLKDIVDERLNSIRDFSYQILYNNVSMRLLDAGGEDSFKSQQAYGFVNNIQDFVISNNFIEDIFVYYPKYDFILGKDGAYKSYSYYLLCHNRDPDGYESWKSMVEGAPNMAYFTQRDGNAVNLFFARYICKGEGSQKGCILVCKIERSSVSNILGWSNTQYTNELAAITTSNRQIYAYSGEASLLSLPRNAYVAGDVSGSGQKYFYYQNYFIGIQPSAISGLNYILIRNRGNALSIQTSVTNILLFCFITCLACGVGLSLFMSFRNSKPLLSLLSHAKADGSETQNEYEVISGKIDQLFLENETAIRQLEQQQKIISGAFVKAVLSLDYRNATAINEIIANYKIDFENNCFCTVLLKFSARGKEEIPGWIHNRINDFSEKYLQPNFDVYHARFLEYDAFLVNFQSGDVAAPNAVTDFCEGLTEFVTSSGFRCRCVSGGVYDNSSGLGVSCQEARLLLEPDKVNLKRNLKEIGKFTPSNQFYNFQRSLLARDFISAKRILPDLFQKYLADVPEDVRLCRQDSIVNLVMEALLHQPSAEDNQQKEYRQSFLGERSPEKLEEKLKQALDDLCEMEKSRFTDTTRSKSDSSDSTVLKIRRIIDECYSDPMLCLNSISNRLEVSNSYISRVFKEKCGLGVMEYLNLVRIEHAKAIIAQGDMSIKDIASKVGFSSDVSFIRVFKKYERITPGKYRQ